MDVYSERFANSVERHLGFRFDESNLVTLAEVFQRRLQKTGLSAESYLHQLGKSPPPKDELAALASELTVGETYFFRNSDQFQALADCVFPELMRTRPGRRLRVLSAGCASGEEPYSLAMLVRQGATSGWEVTIKAVDLNPLALNKAARAQFSVWALRETTSDMQQRWFIPEGKDFLLNEEIRSAVTFEQHNLADPEAAVWLPASYDVIFCRNVMMYFSREHAQALIGSIARSLTPGGYLFLGHAETLRGIASEFQLCHTHETFYYRLNLPGPLGHSSSKEGISAPPVEDRSWLNVVESIEELRTTLAKAEIAEATPQAKPAPRQRWNLGFALDLLQRERYSEALDLISGLPRESDRDPDVMLLRGVLLTHGGSFAAAEECCAGLLQLDEMSAGAHYLLALCREGLGDVKGAMEQYQIAVYLDPGFAMARLHLGLLSRRSGEKHAARRQLGQALTLLHQEETSRLLLFGGGFNREMLMTLCREELAASGGLG